MVQYILNFGNLYHFFHWVCMLAYLPNPNTVNYLGPMVIFVFDDGIYSLSWNLWFAIRGRYKSVLPKIH